MKDVDRTFGRLLRALRERSGLSQLDVASSLGVSSALISKWERGTRTPTLAQLQRIERSKADLKLTDQELDTFRVALGARAYVPDYPAERTEERVFLSDEPIHRPEEDLLNRGPIVERLYQATKKWNERSALILGLSGGWGQGKTSVLNLLRYKLKMDDDFAVVDFDPWLFNAPETIIEEFLRTLGERIVQESGSDARKILEPVFGGIRRLLSSLSITAPLVTVDVSRLLVGDDSLEDMLGEVRTQSARSGKRFIVLLDDLDRLPADELRLVFKLVKLWTRFENFVYVLPLDPHVIRKKLKTEFEEDARFLEKVVHVEVRLPSVEQRQLDNFMSVMLNKLSDAFGLGLTEQNPFWDRFQTIWRTGLHSLVRDFRGAKRFMNAIAFMTPIVQGEVNLADFFALEAIRLEYPLVYSEIAAHKGAFVGESGMFPEKDERTLNESFDKFGDQTEARRDTPVASVLAELFPRFAKYLGRGAYETDSLKLRREQRVASEEKFDNYFWAVRPASEVSDVYVRRLIDSLNREESAEKVRGEIELAFREYSEKGLLYDLLDRLVIFSDEFSKVRRLAIARAVADLADMYSGESKAFLDSEFRRARALFFCLLKGSEGSKDLAGFLQQIVQNAPIQFAAQMVRHSSPERNQIITNYENIDQAKLRTTLRRRFQSQYVEEQRDILEEQPYWGVTILYDLDDRDLVTSYVLDLVRRKPERAADFVSRYRTDWPYGQKLRMAEMGELIDVKALATAVDHMKEEISDDDGLLELLLRQTLHTESAAEAE